MPKKLQITIDRSTFDSANRDQSKYKAKPGLSKEVVLEISRQKQEPDWMLEKRLKALELYQNTSLPAWGPSLKELNLDNIVYFVRPDTKEAKSWDDVPADIRATFEKLGIPEAEQKSLSGVGAQYDSDVVYHKLKKEWEEKGVIFENMDVAVQKYPDMVKKYFMTSCVPINDHKFVMLHGAVWSGGTFIYVPPGVKVDIPLQAYFRMNAELGGQFEHTLIIADRNSEVHYIEGCSAPRFEAKSLHAGCVELFVHEGSRMRYSSIENWSKNTYNLNTKRALVDRNGIVEWVNGNMGCLVGETKIFTNQNKPTTIQNIKIGDAIYAWNEATNSIKKTRVKEKIFSGQKRVFALEAGGRRIEASASHPFLTLVRKKNNPKHKKGFFLTEWKKLEELREGDLIALAKKLPHKGTSYALPSINNNTVVRSKNQYSTFTMDIAHLLNNTISIPKKTNEDFMWLAGLLMGDGHVDIKQNKINIATHVTEDYRDELCRVLKTLFNYEVTEKKERYIIINSKQLCLLFFQLGLAGTAKTKTVPPWIFTLPANQINSFLSGYFDADGHVGQNSLAFTSISKTLLEDVKELGITLGFGVSNLIGHNKAGKKMVVGNLCNTCDSWRLLFNGPQVYTITSRCKRKCQKIKQLKTHRNCTSSGGLNFRSKVNEYVGYTRIAKLQDLGIKPTFDIEVEKYNNFIANGLIVHNSGTTMLYPCSVLRGENARSESLGIAFAGPGQNQDTGSKVIHAAPHTSSVIKSKSISAGGGVSSYRGLVRATPQAKHSKSSVTCDTLLLDDASTSNTYPYIKIANNDMDVAHEATVGKIGDEEIFYLMSRGLSQENATKLVVSGFIAPVIKQLPLEYAVELNKLIELEMEGAVG